MRNLIFNKMLLVAIVLPLVIVSCKKDDKSSKPAASNNDKPFAFVKDGNSQDYSKNASVILFGTATQIIGMKEMSSPSNRISIDILDSVKLGVHKFGESMVSASYVEENDTSTTYYHAIDGQLNIKSFDKDNKTISGTFYFTGETNSSETVSITNGQFNIK